MTHRHPSDTHSGSATPSGNMVPDFSVIIVNWNARNFLEECLSSLSQGISRSYEVLVVDNASSDGSAEMVQTMFPWVSLVQTGANLGFSKGNNIGIERSRGKYIALVNSDVNVFPGCLDSLAVYLEDNPDVGMVGPRILYGDRTQQSSCRRFPSLWNNACEVFGLNKLFPKSAFFAGEHMFYFAYDCVREVEVLVGCFIFARRAAVNQFGVMDERFWMYGEDIDWSRRCWQSGWKVMFFPDAEAIHYCGGSSKNDYGRFSVAQMEARIILLAKYHSRIAQLCFMGLQAIQCMIRLIAYVILRVFPVIKPSTPSNRIRVQVDCLCMVSKSFWSVLWKSRPSSSNMEAMS